MPAGRPTLLTATMIEDVKRILPTVLYMETVGDYLDVSRQTWRGWLRRGRKESSRLARSPKAQPKESESLYLEFFAAVKKALAEGEIYDAGVIKKAAAEQWTAAAWRLERRFPDRWGRDTRDIADIKAQLRQLERSVGQSNDAAAQPAAPAAGPAAGD